MKRHLLVLLPVLLVSSCNGANNAPKEDVISLYSDSSRLYFKELSDEKSCLLKTYRHKYFGEIPYVELGEYVDTFKETDFNEKKNYEIKDGKFVIADPNKGTFVIDADKDTITSSSDIAYFYKGVRGINNGISLDIFKSKDSLTNMIKESPNTAYKVKGQERTYDLKKYNFDIVYEKSHYYAPFSALNLVFYGYLNTTYIYNGKHFFDCDYITASNTVTQYCYSSNGNFLLDRSGGKFGALLYKRVDPLHENEAYRFENIIEQSSQKTIFSCLKDGTGTIKSYDSEGKEIDDGTILKLTYKVNEAKTEIEIKYFAVLEEGDTEPISDVFTLLINLDETYFGRKTRSKEVADFTYQELRFAMYELYGKTLNTKVKDFDSFIKDKDYKDDLLSLDIDKYDDAMARFLLLGIDDVHTTIEYTSIYGTPNLANKNYYHSKYEGKRKDYVSSGHIKYANSRKEAGIGALDITNKTAFVAFDKFEFSDSVKGFDEYKNSDPEKWLADNSMEFFASAFNKIKENNSIKNVVIDLTANSGGRTASMSYLLAYLSKEPSILVNLDLDRSIIDYRYQIDLNLDGQFATDLDSFQDKYNFYILTSDCSFSCANLFATACKNGGYAKIIGQQSAGGSCVISMLCNSTGFLYHSSSEYVQVLFDGTGYKDNDGGVEVDISLDPAKFYDHTYIDSILK